MARGSSTDALRAELAEVMTMYTELLAEETATVDEDARAELLEELEELEEELLECRKQLGLPSLSPAQLQQIKSDMEENVALLEEMKAEQPPGAHEAAEAEQLAAELEEDIADGRLKLGLDVAGDGSRTAGKKDLAPDIREDVVSDDDSDEGGRQDDADLSRGEDEIDEQSVAEENAEGKDLKARGSADKAEAAGRNRQPKKADGDADSRRAIKDPPPRSSHPEETLVAAAAIKAGSKSSIDSPAVANLRAAVAEFDATELAGEELVPIIAAAAGDEKLLKQLFVEADKDGSGHLSFDEFKMFLQTTVVSQVAPVTPPRARPVPSPEEGHPGSVSAPIHKQHDATTSPPESSLGKTPPPIGPMDPETKKRLDELRAKTPKHKQAAAVKKHLASSAGERSAAAASDVDRVVEMRLWSAAKRDGQPASDLSKVRATGTPPRSRPVETPEKAKADARAKRAAFLQQQKREAIKQGIKSSKLEGDVASGLKEPPRIPNKTPPRTRPQARPKTPPGLESVRKPEPEPEPEPEPDSEPEPEPEPENVAANHTLPSSSQHRREVAKELRRAQKKFRIMDKDGSSTLTGDEIEALAAWVFASFHPGGEPMSAEQKTGEATKIRNKCDANGDGAISFDEFSLWFQNTADEIYRSAKRKAQQKQAQSAPEPDPGLSEDEMLEIFSTMTDESTNRISFIALRNAVDLRGINWLDDELQEMLDEVCSHGDGEVDETDFIAAVAENSAYSTRHKWLELLSTAPMRPRSESNVRFKGAVNRVSMLSGMSSMVHNTNRIGKTVAPKDHADPNAAIDNHVAQIATCFQMGLGKLNESLEHVPADGKGYSGSHELIAHAEPQPWVRGLELPPFSVREYAADVFSEIRTMYRINTIAYKAALGMIDWTAAGSSARMPDLRIVGQADAAGKSAAWFFLSSNQQYILKLTTKKELALMCEIMQSYHERIRKAREEADANQQWLPNTLLPQIFGTYTVRVGNQETHWIVMRNILASECKIHEKYDLKGSSKGRSASVAERNKGFGAILKCNDFRKARLAANKPIVVGRSAERLRHALQQDVAFLNQYHLIDYSLLVGIHHKRPEWRAAHQYRVGDIAYVEDVDDDGHPDKRLECIEVIDSVGTGRTGDMEPQWQLGEERQDGDIIWRCESGEAEAHVLSAADRKTLTYSENQDELLFYGIIDILTKYTAKKKAERFACGSVRCSGPEISCQPPDQYGQRFYKFISASMVDDDPAVDNTSFSEAPRRSVSSLEDQAEFVEHPPADQDDVDAIMQERERSMRYQELKAPEDSIRKDELEQETVRVVALFNELDTSGNGTLNIDELSVLGEKLNAGWTEEILEEIFRVKDLDGRGEISVEEFLEWWLPRVEELAILKELDEINQSAMVSEAPPAETKAEKKAREKREKEEAKQAKAAAKAAKKTAQAQAKKGKKAKSGSSALEDQTDDAGEVWVGFADDPHDPDAEWAWKNSATGEWLPQGEYPPEGDLKWWQIVHVNEDGSEEVYFENDHGEQQFEEPGVAQDEHTDEHGTALVELDAGRPLPAEEVEDSDQHGREGAPDAASEEAVASGEGDHAEEDGAGGEFIGWLEQTDGDGNTSYVDLVTKEPRDPTLEDPVDDIWVWDDELQVYMMMDEDDNMLMMNEHFEIVDEGN